MLNKYRTAMFQSYWVPILIFYVIPIFLLAIGYSKIEIILDTIIFPISLLLIGYFIAPYFGPKVVEGKKMHS